MAYLEVPSPEQGPYTALIGSDEDFSTGTIRIEPPFTPGKTFDLYAHSYGIYIDLLAITGTATLLDYTIGDSKGDLQKNADFVIDGVGSLLKDLGATDSKETFIKYWKQFKI